MIYYREILSFQFRKQRSCTMTNHRCGSDGYTTSFSKVVALFGRSCCTVRRSSSEEKRNARLSLPVPAILSTLASPSRLLFIIVDEYINVLSLNAQLIPIKLSTINWESFMISADIQERLYDILTYETQTMHLSAV